MYEIAYRISRKASLMGARLADAFSPAEIAPTFENSACGDLPFKEVRQQLQGAAQLLVPSRCAPFILKELLGNYPGYVEALVREADAICRHVIPVFRTSYDFGAEINWHKDLVSGHEWPRVFFAKIRPIELADDSDIKFPWELSRFHHAVTLGTAFWLTRREKYAKEFVAQVTHWVQQNPPNKGVNWVCAMEVAIRASNLIWAFSLMRESKCLSDEFVKRFLNLLRVHGEHIRRHLENRKRIRGNHYIADLVGLLYIASFCPFFRHSRRWSHFCINELKSELRDQVLADGTDFEGSISYHRLVTEMLFHAAYIGAKAQGPPGVVQTSRGLHGVAARVFGSEFLHRLETMFDYILHYTRPDGLAPQVGDNDSGRFILFPSPGQACTDHRHLLALGGGSSLTGTTFAGLARGAGRKRSGCCAERSLQLQSPWQRLLPGPLGRAASTSCAINRSSALCIAAHWAVRARGPTPTMTTSALSFAPRGGLLLSILVPTRIHGIPFCEICSGPPPTTTRSLSMQGSRMKLVKWTCSCSGVHPPREPYRGSRTLNRTLGSVK